MKSSIDPQFAFRILLTVAAVTLLYSLHQVFMIVPNERIMGPVQRIFYFHVGSAIACYAGVFGVFVASLWHFATRDPRADSLNKAASEVAFVFATGVLLSGMIWGHSAWNTWFRWEPRLVTFLFLWLLLGSTLVLRSFGDTERSANHSAVMGILVSISVPLVVFSIRFMPQVAQLHPVVVEQRGLADSRYVTALLWSLASLILLQILLTWLSYRIDRVQKSRED